MLNSYHPYNYFSNFRGVFTLGSIKPNKHIKILHTNPFFYFLLFLKNANQDHFLFSLSFFSFIPPTPQIQCEENNCIFLMLTPLEKIVHYTHNCSCLSVRMHEKIKINDWKKIKKSGSAKIQSIRMDRNEKKKKLRIREKMITQTVLLYNYEKASTKSTSQGRAQESSPLQWQSQEGTSFQSI